MKDDSAILYKRLLSYVRPHAKVFALAVIGMIAAAATEPLIPALIKPLLDGGFAAVQAAHPPIFYAAVLVGLFLLRGVLTFTSSYFLAWVANRVVLDLRAAMFSRLVRLPTRFFDDNSSGVLLSKIAYAAHRVVGAAGLAPPAAHGARGAALDGRPRARARGDDRVPPRGQGLRRAGVRIQALRARQPGGARVQHAPDDRRVAHQPDHPRAGVGRARRHRLPGDGAIPRRPHHGGRVRLLPHRHADAARAAEAPHRDPGAAAARPGRRRERVRHDRHAGRGRPRHGGTAAGARRAGVRTGRLHLPDARRARARRHQPA
ncbi:MAG: hypothetical protein E6H41_11585, partial [Betaproteobacteria bacterium]